MTKPSVPVGVHQFSKPGLQLMARAEEPVDVARQADVGLMAIGVAEALAGRLRAVDVDAGRDVERRRMLLRSPAGALNSSAQVLGQCMWK